MIYIEKKSVKEDEFIQLLEKSKKMVLNNIKR